MKLHIAREGDTIISLSDKYGVSPDRILELNPQIAETGIVERGAKVRIPSGPVSMLNAHRAEGQPNEGTMAAQSQANVQAQAPAQTQAQAPQPSNEAAEAEANMTANAHAKPVTMETDETAQAAQPAPAANEQAMPNATTPPISYLYSNAAEKKAAPMYPLGLQESDYPNMVNPYASNAGVLEQGTAPAYYKTEPAVGNPSPLYVKWKGMYDDDNAVNPFQQVPTPAVPAGAAAPFQQQMPAFYQEPNVSGAYGMVVPEPFVPQIPLGGYGPGAGVNAAPSAFGMPAAYAPFGVPVPMPGAYGMPIPAPYGAPVGDCGCGGPQVQLPYALPKRYDEPVAAQQQDASRAVISGVPAEFESESETAAKPESESNSAPKAKSSTKVKGNSRTDSLQALLKRAKEQKKRTRRGSTPWVND